MWMGLIHRIGRRGAFLLFVALVNFVYFYIQIIAHGPAREPMGFAPWDVWTWYWFATGVIVLLGAFLRRDRFAFGFGSAIFGLYSARWAIFWLRSGIPNLWVNVILWAAFSGIVAIVAWWPEVRVKYETPRILENETTKDEP